MIRQFLPNQHDNCPICGRETKLVPRYPKYLCRACASRTCSADGRKVSYFNLDLSGGIGACYVDTQEAYEETICFVDGVACTAREAHMGGIVVQLARGADK